MENNKKGTRTHFTRRPAEGRAEKVEYGRREGDTAHIGKITAPAVPLIRTSSRSAPMAPVRPVRRGNAGAMENTKRTARAARRASAALMVTARRASARTASASRSAASRTVTSLTARSRMATSPARPATASRPSARSRARPAAASPWASVPRPTPAWSDDDTAKTPIKEVVRLNKYIANSGVCSRREADTLIQSGVVTVNGEVVTELGTKVNVLTDDIRFNGERLKGEEKVYIVMNKPKGYVTTASDPHAEKTVMDILKGCPTRVFPVGRLDKNTTGVLMFTNDGEMAERLTHPSYNKKKIYQVVLDHPLTEEDKEKVLAGIELTDGVVAADELEYIDARDHRQLGIEIHSGKNRIVRRIFESMGYEVKALDRVYFAGLTKKGLKKGDWRYLTEGEVNILKMGAYV